MLTARFEKDIAVFFSLGHLEAFDWNLIGKTTLGLDPFHEHFDNLFAFGIDPVNGNLPSFRTVEA